jgi:hypothetical protein
MKKAATILLLTGFFLHSFGQTKSIHGFITDDYTNYRIDSVSISPVLFKEAAYSDERGKFEIILPKNYHDTIVFTHPGYYPYVKRIRAGEAIRPQFIRLIPTTFKLDTICFTAYKENRSITGLIEDGIHKEPIINAQIRLANNKIIAYSKLDGKFKTVIPKSTKNLIINHPEFNTLVFPIAQLKGHTPYPEIKMFRKVPLEKDTSWKNWNNYLSWTINEMIAGGIGLRYERFLKFRHSVGLHCTYYFHGYATPVAIIGMGSSTYKGVKVYPFYRFYVWREFQKGGFAEVKLTTGYFDFSRLHYGSKEGDYGDNIATNFWTAGIAVAWGWYFRPRKIDHLVLNLSIGLQYLPMKVPKSMETQHYGTYHVDDTWWYFSGPGSVLEIKFIIGGIF